MLNNQSQKKQIPTAVTRTRPSRFLGLPLITTIIKLPLPPNPPGHPVSDIARKRRHTASLGQVAGRVDAAAVVPASGAVEVADVVRQAGHDAALGVGFLQQLREAVAGVGAVGAIEDHLVDCRGWAGREGAAGHRDVGVGVGAEGGEHGGGLVASLGAVGAGRCG